MKKKYMLLSLMSMLGIGMQAQTAYTYVKQNDAVVTADGVAAYSIESGNISIGFDDDNNAVMTNSSNNTIAKLDVTEGGVLTADFDNQSGESTTTTGSKEVTVTQPYGTFFSPFQLEVPVGSSVEVYAPEYKNDKLYLTASRKISSTDEENKAVIPAGTGLMLKNAGSITFSFTDAASNVSLESALNGTAVVKTVTAGDILTLGYPKNATGADRIMGFYSYSKTSLAATKAYLEKSLVSEAKAIQFCFDDDIDGVDSIEQEEPAVNDAPAYNILGQRVCTNAKGIVIMNGKKYLNK